MEVQYHHLNISDIVRFCSIGEELMRRLQTWGSIASDGNVLCPNEKCKAVMVLKPTTDSSYRDGFVWTCVSKYSERRNTKLIRCHRRTSIRKGTFFDKAKLSIEQILIFVNLWMDHCELMVIKKQARISSQTGTDWNSFCREVVIDSCFERSQPIGGPGEIVEIDESKFGRRKHYRGHRVEGQWVFGGTERRSGRFFLVPVENRSAATLVPLIEQWILPGTVIISDCWASYNTLGQRDFRHLRVNHSITFKDPETGAHTNTVEGMWRHAKARIPQYRRIKEFFLGYLARFMFITYVRRQGLDPTVEFMRAAGELYNANNQRAAAISDGNGDEDETEEEDEEGFNPDIDIVEEVDPELGEEEDDIYV